MNKNVSRGTAAALCVLTGITAFTLSYVSFEREFNRLLPEYRKNEEIYGKLGEIRSTIDGRYVGQYELQDAVDMAAAGYVAGVGDRWSSYLSADAYSKYKMSFAGESFGVGLYTSYSDKLKAIRIVEVYPDSDGIAAGLQKGDLILGAEGKTVAQDGYDAVIAAIQGDEGTKAGITIRRSGQTTNEVVQLTRKTLSQLQVTGSMLSDGKTALIRIYNFRQQSETQFRDAVNAMLEQGATQLVFDVRQNPGGSVESVCDCLDMLLPEGRIMTLRTKAGKETDYDSDASEVGMPMAVLVDSSSISAAEFFAAALQEYGKATIVGDQTIGKGYSQQNYELSDGSALHLSDQEYFTPQGKTLIGTGVVPDVSSSLETEKLADFYFLTEAQDTQLQAALRTLAE